MQESLDLKELLDILLRRIWLLVTCTIACAVAVFLISKFIIPPKYTAESLLYINNTERSSVTANLNINDINASQKLVNTYIVILQSDAVLDTIVQQGELDYTREQLEKMISYKAVNNTEVLSISVESRDPEESALLANAIAEVSPEELIRVTKAGSVEVVSRATTPDKASSPNSVLNAIIGGMLGFAVSVLSVLLVAMLDTTVKDEEDIAKHYNIPTLGMIPDFLSHDKGGYHYGSK